MSYFEDFISNVKDLGDAVSKKTGEIVDVTRLKVNVSDINKEIKRLYEVLGGLVYKSQKSGADISSEVFENTKKIDALNARLEILNKQIADMQDKNVCPACGSAVEKKAVFCPRCGERVKAGK